MRFHVIVKGLLAIMVGATGFLVPVSASAAVAVDQESNYPDTSANPGSLGSAWISKNQWSAQPFVARSTGKLTSVTLAMSVYEEVTVATNFTVSIFATSNGLPTGAPLASKFFNQASVDSLSVNRVVTPNPVVVDFTNPPDVVAGTVYAIQLTTTDGGGDIYHWFVGNYCMKSLYWEPYSGAWVEYLDALAFTTTVDGTSEPSGDLPAPVNVRTESSSDGVSLSFNMCEGNGEAIDFGLTNTEFLLNGSGSWQPLTPADAESPVLIPGLPDDTPLSIQVRVLGTGGMSPASTPVNFTAGLVASAPTNVVALPIDEGAQISFTAGSGNGKPITGYQYNIFGSQEWLPVDGGAVTSPVTVSGLTNGTSTRFSIRAVTARGGGRSSNLLEVYPGTPDAPVSLVATPVDGGVSIAFEICSTGSTAITNVEYRLNWNNFEPVDPPSITSPVFVPMSGTSGVTLRLVNSFGPSIDSEWLNVTAGIGQPQVVGAVTTCAGSSDGQDDGSSGGSSDGQDDSSTGGASGGGPENSLLLSSDSSNSSIPPADTSTVLAPSSLLTSTVANTQCSVTVGVAKPVQSISHRRLIRVARGAVNPSTRKASGVASLDTCLAPVVLAKIGVPTRALVTGLPAGKIMRLQAMVNGRWRSLGMVKTTAQGMGTTPAIVSRQPGAVMLSVDSATVGRYFVRLLIENRKKRVLKKS